MIAKIKAIKQKIKDLIKRIKAYIKRFMFPLYLMPIKLFTYSLYYILRLIGRTIISLIKIFFDMIFFPFKSLKNLLKSFVIIGIILYIPLSLFVIVDYMAKEYGDITKIYCSWINDPRPTDKIVRIVGGYSQGSGFFIAPDRVLTNFHVIDDEPSPKIIFPDGSFITTTNITGDKDVDLAILETKEQYPNMVLKLSESFEPFEDEALFAIGYPLGTDIQGEATVLKGKMIASRRISHGSTYYLQSDINLVSGMSGGPLIERCGQVVGVNTMGLAGLSLFVPSFAIQHLSSFTDADIQKIEVDPSLSPEDAVYAFYTYLKARRMEDGFNLLSEEYLKKTDFEEWTSRFTDILDVEIYYSELYKTSDDTVYVKFSTNNWVNDDIETHYYEGTWETVWEDGVYKMNKSNIREALDPSYPWKWSGPEEE